MQVISSIGGMPRERNKQSCGSTAGSRMDLWIGQPPVVAVEEKASETELNIALGEVHKKVGALDEDVLPREFSELEFFMHLQFVFIPHYENIKFVIGIGIAGDLLKMEAFGRQGVVSSTDVLNLSKINDCIK